MQTWQSSMASSEVPGLTKVKIINFSQNNLKKSVNSFESKSVGLSACKCKSDFLADLEIHNENFTVHTQSPGLLASSTVLNIISVPNPIPLLSIRHSYHKHCLKLGSGLCQIWFAGPDNSVRCGHSYLSAH